MKIRTSGKPTKISLQACKEAVAFFGEKLLSTRINPLVELKIKFLDDLQEFALMSWVDTNINSRKFLLEIDANLLAREMLLALAHEMVHLRQFATGQMKDRLKSSHTRFQGELYDLDTIDYWESPWEIEAYGREKGLVVKFLEHKRLRMKWKGNQRWIL